MSQRRIEQLAKAKIMMIPVPWRKHKRKTSKKRKRKTSKKARRK